LAVKILCLIISIIVHILFRIRLKKFGELNIPTDLKIITVLSLLLIFFNDPLYIFNIYLPNFALSVFSGIFLTTFLTFILFYWIFAFQRVGESDDYKTETLTVIKAVFFGV
jgi:hypothetical protein